MQRMSSDSSEVCALISALASKVQSCEESLDAQAVGNALYGMNGLTGVDSVIVILDRLFSHLSFFVKSSVTFESLATPDLVCLGQNMAMSLPVLRKCLKEGEYEKWKEVGSLVSVELGKRKLADISHHGFQSSAAKNALNASDLLLSSNEHLFDLFESDIVVRSRVDGGECFVLNIEVDGIHHKREKSKRFCMLRDEYLRSRGVVVERIDTSQMRRMKEEELREWVVQRVANVRAVSVWE
jgi:hypothetical protein